MTLCQSDYRYTIMNKEDIQDRKRSEEINIIERILWQSFPDRKVVINGDMYHAELPFGINIYIKRDVNGFFAKLDICHRNITYVASAITLLSGIAILALILLATGSKLFMFIEILLGVANMMMWQNIIAANRSIKYILTSLNSRIRA